MGTVLGRHRRQILTSKDGPRDERVKPEPLLNMNTTFSTQERRCRHGRAQLTCDVKQCQFNLPSYLIWIFTHLNLRLADAIHNFKWVKINRIWQNGGQLSGNFSDLCYVLSLTCLKARAYCADKKYKKIYSEPTVLGLYVTTYEIHLLVQLVGSTSHACWKQVTRS